MTDNEDLYCKIFVDTNLNNIKLINLIAGITTGEIDNYITGTIMTDIFEIDVIDNDDFNNLKRKGASDGFLYYRYYLDIEPNEGADKDQYIFLIGQLLQGLWNNKCKAVAACDFEEQLPMKGGYGY